MGQKRYLKNPTLLVKGKIDSATCGPQRGFSFWPIAAIAIWPVLHPVRLAVHPSASLKQSWVSRPKGLQKASESHGKTGFASWFSWPIFGFQAFCLILCVLHVVVWLKLLSRVFLCIFWYIVGLGFKFPLVFRSDLIDGWWSYQCCLTSEIGEASDEVEKETLEIHWFPAGLSTSTSQSAKMLFFSKAYQLGRFLSLGFLGKWW